MGTMSVVMSPPPFDQDRRFFQGIEDLHVQQLVSELAVETFAVTVLPRAAGLDEQRADVEPFQPVSYRMSTELRSIVRSNVVGWTMGDEQLGEQRQNVIAVQPSRYQDRQTFASELVDHHQHTKRPTIMGTFLDKVISPDMMAPARSKPDTGTIIQPETTPLGLSRRHLQPFSPPDPRDPFGIHMPPLGTQQGRDPAIAVTAKLAGKVDNRFSERYFVIRHFGNMPLGRAGLTENPTGPTLGNTECLLNMVDVVPTTLNAKERSRAQKFPDAASFRISLSSVRSATAFLSLAFSRSSSFRRLA